MTIRKITIENFTVFKNIEVDFCNGINILIGENATGKTHLLKLLYALNTLYSSDYLVNMSQLFGRNFRVCNCWLSVNDTLEQPWRVGLDNGVMLAPESRISATIEAKKPGTYIPAMSLLSIPDITRVVDEYGKNIDIDYTQTEIVRKAENTIPENIPPLAKASAQPLEDEIGGKVHFDVADKSFWIYKNNGEKIPYSAEAEGHKKFGLLWRLLMNKGITKDTVLFWDEPEANLNPTLIPILVEVLMELARSGVQIFLATHDYNLMKYFSVKMKASDEVAFLSLYKTESGVACERENDYDLLEHNSIVDADIQMVKDEIGGSE